jgi:acetyl esterase/lipase
MHGGGFVGFAAKHMVPVLQPLAEKLDCVIVTVDYRLAPETRLSGSLEDNYAALRWLRQSAAELGVDPNRLVIAGESAGGGHAAMLAIAARDRGGPSIRAQILTYPMLDDRTGSTHPVPSFVGTYVWQPEDNRYGWSSLLGVPAGSRRAPAHLVPGRVQDLSGLPPTFIGVGSLDLFVDEDVEYARRLIASGVPTELHVYPGAFHGFEIFVPEARISTAFLDAREQAYRRAFR